MTINDPRAGETLKKYISIMNEIQALQMEGFGYLLDTADKDEMDDLVISADVLLESIARTKRALGR